MVDEQQQQEIAQGLREGKTDAWLALYDAYSRKLWEHVARLMGPYSAEIADVVQETFLAAARSAAGYDPERGSLWLWLGGIARNQVALHFRKRQRHDRERQLAEASKGQSDREETARWFDNRELDPADALETAERISMVREALTQLPDHYETLLTAKYFADATIEQIAQAENATASAIRSKLARARRAFCEVFTRRVEGTGSDRELHGS